MAQTYVAMMIMAISVAISRLSGLITHIVLGYWLTPADFGIYAAVIGLSAAFVGAKNGGIYQFLTKESVVGVYKEQKYLPYALTFNIVSVALFLLIASWRYSDSWQHMFVAILISCTILTALSKARLRSFLSSRLRFKSLGAYDVLSSFLRSIVAVAAALSGAGAASLALPFAAVAILDLSLVKYFAGLPLNVWRRIRVSRLIYQFRRFRWMLLSSMVVSIILYGDYLILGEMVNPRTLGIYFFGFQLTSVLANVFANAMQAVLLPRYAQISDKRELQAEYQDNLLVLGTASGIFCVALFMMSPSIVNFMWQGRWDEAIPVIQLGAIALSYRLFLPSTYSLLEAMGHWSFKAKLQLVDAIGLLVAAFLAGLSGELQKIIIWIFSQRLLFTVLTILYVQKVLAYELKPAVTALVLTSLTLGISVFCSIFIIGDSRGWTGLSLSIMVCVLCLGIQLGLFTKYLKTSPLKWKESNEDNSSLFWRRR